MLKSYDYVENTSILASDTSLLEEERAIAESFLNEQDSCLIDNYKRCSACDSATAMGFMDISGIKYMRCHNCYSIYALANADLSAKYEAYPKLVEFKKSRRYIESIIGKAFLWEEWMLWIHFRSARYLGKSQGYKVFDYSETFKQFPDMVNNAPFCDEYLDSSNLNGKQADLIFYIDTITKEVEPLCVLKDLRKHLAEDGILAIGGRVGSGFDILVLKELNRIIFPMKYVFLPSSKGFEILLNRAGYDVLEMSTPGALDVEYVLRMKEVVEDSFLSHFLGNGDAAAFGDFQRFLQKHGLSSYSRIIAKKRKDK